MTPPTGYHVVDITVDAAGRVRQDQQTLIVSPGRCTALTDRIDGTRAHGIWSNLYSIRSDRNWGVGDLTDLRMLCEATAVHGVAFVGINPLHAIRNRSIWIGPYCPVSRLYRNLLYIDVEAVPEFGQADSVRQDCAAGNLKEQLVAVRSADWIAYDRVAKLKLKALRRCHGTFLSHHGHGETDRGRSYREYVQEQGDTLIDYATFMALEAWSTDEGGGGPDWSEWPAEYRQHDSQEVRAFRESHRDAVDLHCYIQFELDRQLGEACRRAHDAGMPLGVYQDLAIGSAANGSDAWAFPGLLLKGVKVGAPPDPYAWEGQTWGFPPVDPRRLRDDRYDYWIRLLRSAMRHTGMLRIDHVMGLFRQYWVPDGQSATQGAYVRFPHDDLLGILALESHRQGTVVVGEDLGTVPREIPSILARWGILSSRVMYFERTKRGGFRPARSYSKRALTTVTTHDHTPLAGYWEGRDIALRETLGVYDAPGKLSKARAEREIDREALVRRLVAAGLLAQDDPEGITPETLCRAVHLFLAQTPSPLIGISLDDLAGETEPVNLPGVTIDRYRSWSRRMRRTLDEIASDPRVLTLLDDLTTRING